MKFKWNNGDWVISGDRQAARRGVTAAAKQPMLGRQLDTELGRVGIEIELVHHVEPSVRRGRERPALDFTVDAAPGERAVTILRHPSGAITFHAPLAATTAFRGRRREAASQHFRIDLGPETTRRRGLMTAAIKLIVVKVRKKLVDAAISAGLPAAALRAEAFWWRRRNLNEGWHKIIAATGGVELAPVLSDDFDGHPSLLLLHGTFSDTIGSFGALFRPRVFAALKARYGGRIFGFEHFSVSRSPRENARMLLESLPDREHRFDVISYSRGGLVLRTLAE